MGMAICWIGKMNQFGGEMAKQPEQILKEQLVAQLQKLNYGLLGNWAGHWIIISIIFDQLDASEEAQALAVQSSGHMDTETKDSYSVYLPLK
jgi:hypothetical protein